MQVAKPLFDYSKYWTECFDLVSFLPMSREEMDQLGRDSYDIIIVIDDAYVDHPSFSVAIIDHLLEAQESRVSIIIQPDWQSKNNFMKLGEPSLSFGVAAGNMNSIINRYIADKKVRSDGTYTPGGLVDKRLDRTSLVHNQHYKETYNHVPVILGGIETSSRRIAHYDYWQDEVRRSVLMGVTTDILFYGNAEHTVAEIVRRLTQGEPLNAITDIHGTVFVRHDTPEGQFEIDFTRTDRPGRVDRIIGPYMNTQDTAVCAIEQEKGVREDPQEAKAVQLLTNPRLTRGRTVVRLPSFKKMRNDPVLYAHANHVLHLETSLGDTRALMQKRGKVDVWFDPPPIPMGIEEMNHVFGMPYVRIPYPAYGKTKIPVYEMIRFPVNITRGCFDGCTLCSVIEHEGRIIRNRPHDSIIHEVKEMRDKVPGFTGVIFDLGGPTMNMYRITYKSPDIGWHRRRPSCVLPGICEGLDTDHSSLTELYRGARALPGVKKTLIVSGLCCDSAVEPPECVKELITRHVGGYLKITLEHTERGPSDKMMKPGISTYDRFKQMFEKFSKEAGKEQYLIPYFIAAHPGTTDENIMNLTLWLKRNGFRTDQVQAFYPSPMATAAATYRSGKNPLRKVAYRSDGVTIVKSDQQRHLHKAFLRYHDPKGWPLLREALGRVGRADLIGNGKHHLIPTYQPDTGEYQSARRKSLTPAGSKKADELLTQHIDSPPHASGGSKPWGKGQQSRTAALAKGKKKSRQPNIPR